MPNLQSLCKSASKNEVLKIWLNDMPVAGRFSPEEVLDGQVPGLPKDVLEECNVLRWYSMVDGFSKFTCTSYTIIECRYIEVGLYD